MSRKKLQISPSSKIKKDMLTFEPRDRVTHQRIKGKKKGVVIVVVISLASHLVILMVMVFFIIRVMVAVAGLIILLMILHLQPMDKFEKKI